MTLPKGKKALRVWAGCGPEHPVAFLELLDEASGSKRIYSAGKSEKGMLAQGDKILESREFREIKYGSPALVFESLHLGLESATAIDSEGQLWGWGFNENHRLGLDDVADNGIHRPLALYPLNGLNFKAKQVSCGNLHTLILFEDK